MKSKNKIPIETIDWRTRTATTISKDTKNQEGEIIYTKGSAVALSTFVKIIDKDIGFNVPSAPALFLNQAHKLYLYAINNHPSSSNLDTKSIQFTSFVFDYIESISGSIIFSHMAIESFANEEIPNDFIYEFSKKGKAGILIVHQYPKEKIERNLKLSQKLADVLPIILNKQSPKGIKVWEEYKNLEKLRNRIVHLKEIDLQHSKADNMYPQSLWKDLLSLPIPNFPLIAKNIILHFKEPNVHWLKYCPF